jgi:hypothetical protein
MMACTFSYCRAHPSENLLGAAFELMNALHDAAMAELGVATKLNPDWDFLCRLRDSGLAKAAEWLDCNFDKVGRSSTVDLAEVFL